MAHAHLSVALQAARQAYKEDGRYTCHRGWGPYDLVIGIQGSTSMRDLMHGADIGLARTDLLEGLVHRGFHKKYDEIREDLVKNVAGGQKVLFAGHSLGGVLACLAAAEISLTFPESEVSCVSFGSPMFGDLNSSESFARRVPNHARVYVDLDPVVLYPLGRYSHATTGCVVRLRSSLGSACPNPLMHHHMVNYQRSLAQSQKRTSTCATSRWESRSSLRPPKAKRGRPSTRCQPRIGHTQAPRFVA